MVTVAAARAAAGGERGEGAVTPSRGNDSDRWRPPDDGSESAL